MNKKVAIAAGVLAGCGCICVCLCAALFVIFGMGLVFGRDTVDGPNLIEVAEVEVELIVPPTVKIHDDLTIEMRLKNISSTPQLLDSIDIHDSYIHGFAVPSTEPANLRYRTFVGGGVYHSYYFQREIPANSTVTVNFSTTAIKKGAYTGLVYVCINSDTLCNTYEIKTVVED